MTRSRAENPVQYPSGSLNVLAMPCDAGDWYDASTPRDFNTNVRTGSFDQKTSACGRPLSASKRFARPVDFVSSVSYTALTRTPDRRSYSFRIGSEKGRSAETYAVTSRMAGVVP